MHNDKEEVLIEKTVKTTIQPLYDERLFGKYDIADEVLKEYLLIDVNERRWPSLKPLYDKDVLQQFQ